MRSLTRSKLARVAWALGAVAATAAVLMLGAPAQAGRGTEKVTICHIPPGNPANAHTITVGAPAVAAHVAQHGDTIGPCEDAPPEA